MNFFMTLDNHELISRLIVSLNRKIKNVLPHQDLNCSLLEPRASGLAMSYADPKLQ